jgi:flagellar hook-associated protein 1 FlgK
VASTFGGIQQAGSALDAARYGLSVVSQNIANAATPGYTRQVAQQGSVDAVAGVPTIHTRPAGPGGVTITGTDRLVDPVVDARLRTEQARSGYADTTAAQLQQIESVFPEPSDTGLAEQLNGFWNAWAGVADDPGPDAPRTVLLQRATAVAATLNTMSAALGDLATSTGQALARDAGDATSAAAQLATLNGQIALGTATGSDVNALLDQRDRLLSTLSSLVGGVATVNPNGSADVTVGGQSLVSGTTAAAVTVGPSSQMLVGGTAVTLSGGSAAAVVTGLTVTYPDYRSRLDAVATALSSAVNAAQAAGYGRTGTAGPPMFTGTGAADLAVAITDPGAIAAASTPGGNLDGNNALATAGLATSPTGANALYTSLVAGLGSASALAQQQQATQDAVTGAVSALQTSISGVSTDEEVSSLLTYQHAFEAASRVLTTVDSILDTLINHTGLVGRG